jgi:hypothetical protein
MGEERGFIFRIASEQWVSQVFDMATYFTNIRRKWARGQTILFLHKTRVGDALIGYGVVSSVCEKDELSEEERKISEVGGWKRAIQFEYVKQFDNPLPLKSTFLKDSKRRGRYFHGLGLNPSQLKGIISQAEG